MKTRQRVETETIPEAPQRGSTVFGWIAGDDGSVEGLADMAAIHSGRGVPISSSAAKAPAWKTPSAMPPESASRRRSAAVGRMAGAFKSSAYRR